MSYYSDYDSDDDFLNSDIKAPNSIYELFHSNTYYNSTINNPPLISTHKYITTFENIRSNFMINNDLTNELYQHIIHLFNKYKHSDHITKLLDTFNQDTHDENFIIELKKNDYNKIINEIKDIINITSTNYKNLLNCEQKIIKNTKNYDIFLNEIKLLQNTNIYKNSTDFKDIIKKLCNNKIKNCKIKNMLNQYTKLYIKHNLLTSTLQQFHLLLDKPNLCNICFQSKITTVFIPCGHTSCSTCAKKLHCTCHICRKNFKSYLIYL